MTTAETMNILNEAVRMFPRAISFAAGRPPDEFLDTESIERWIDLFVRHSAKGDETNLESVRRSLGQYSDTNGIICDLLAEYLHEQEAIDVAPADCMVTNGAQEAILICLLGLVGPSRSVVATDPTYVGLSGAAEAVGVPMQTIEDGPDMIDELETLLAADEISMPPVGAVYVVPDFSNPCGRTMTVRDRRRLLELAERHDFYIIEDAAYRAFRYDGVQLPTIKSLDKSGRVIYIASFAKLFLPGIRLAVMAADRRDREGTPLAKRLAWIKSYTTVASSPISQAALGGYLLEHDFCLTQAIAGRRLWCQRNRDTMISAFASYFGNRALGRTRWTVPEGGFFLALQLGTRFTAAEFIACARDNGVIAMPMTFFSPSGGFRDQVRFAFSNTTPDKIESGVEKFASFVAGTEKRASFMADTVEVAI